MVFFGKMFILMSAFWSLFFDASVINDCFDGFVGEIGATGRGGSGGGWGGGGDGSDLFGVPRPLLAPLDVSISLKPGTKHTLWIMSNHYYPT